MCYAIPGKVIAIREDVVTVEYFGEEKKAKNDFFDLSTGDYVYARVVLWCRESPPKMPCRF